MNDLRSNLHKLSPEARTKAADTVGLISAEIIEGYTPFEHDSAWDDRGDPVVYVFVTDQGNAFTTDAGHSTNDGTRMFETFDQLAAHVIVETTTVMWEGSYVN